MSVVWCACVGKTLLFSNMSEGKIKDFPKYIHVHHCKELENHELSDTVLGTVVGSHPFRNILIRCEPKINELLANESTPDSQKEGLKDTLMWVQQLSRQIRVYDAEERAQKMLRVLGFDEVGQKKLCSALSGGLRMRVALCMAFFIEADLLLLDEPTNHLDFPSVLWLENRLRGYKSAFLMVSHDRELLNNVTTNVLLLEDKQIKYYQMGSEHAHAFKEFEKKASRVRRRIRRSSMRSRSSCSATSTSTRPPCWGSRSTRRRCGATRTIRSRSPCRGSSPSPPPPLWSNEEKDAEGKPIHPDQISLINLQNVRFSYDVSTGHFIFNDPISFNVLATTRCGVMGPNGAGKSTLLKLLTHKLTPLTALSYTTPHSPWPTSVSTPPLSSTWSRRPSSSCSRSSLRRALEPSDSIWRRPPSWVPPPTPVCTACPSLSAPVSSSLS